MLLLPVRHHAGAVAFVSTPLGPALSDALILLTGDDRDQEKAAEQEDTENAFRTRDHPSLTMLSKVMIDNLKRQFI
jgi:hypothetical protein